MLKDDVFVIGACILGFGFWTVLGFKVFRK